MTLDLGGLWCVSPLHFAAILAEYRLRRSSGMPSPMAAMPSVVRAEVVPAQNGRNIAVVPLTGLLTKGSNWFGTSTAQVRSVIRQAANDPNIHAILISVDSPGGSVSGTQSLASDVRAAAKQKPTWTHISDLGASAAYWIASASDQIFANDPTSLIGSIGTMISIPDLSAAAEKEGIKVHVFSTGSLKGAGTPGTALTAEQQAYYQSIVDATQVHFDAAVKSGRGLTTNQLAAVRSGGVFPAAEALRLKLVDGIQPLDATISKLAKTR